MQAALSPDVERAVEALSRDAREAARALAGSSSAARGSRAAGRGRADAQRRRRRCSPPTRRTSSARGRAGDTAAFIDRLTLTPARIEAMARGLEEIAALPDPVGETIAAWRRPNGLEIAQVRVPIGVVFTIYESRPNVTADSAALCLKTAQRRAAEGRLRVAGDQRAPSPTRSAPPSRPRACRRRPCSSSAAAARWCAALLRRDDRIDVVIARGGETLKRTIMDESRIPVVKHFEGICHLYVDAAADLDMAERLCLNAKVQRPSVCNAIENLVVHERVAPRVPAAHRRGAARARLRGARRRGRAARSSPT